MRVQELNEHELTRVNPQTGEPLSNHWGYNPAAFLAPNGMYYAHDGHCLAPKDRHEPPDTFRRAEPGDEELVDPHDRYRLEARASAVLVA